MVSHGMTLGTLFLAAGMLYDRTHNPMINAYGGLHQVMPRFTALLTIFVMASNRLAGDGQFHRGVYDPSRHLLSELHPRPASLLSGSWWELCTCSGCFSGWRWGPLPLTCPPCRPDSPARWWPSYRWRSSCLPSVSTLASF